MNYDSRIETQAEGDGTATDVVNPLLEPDEEDQASRKRLWIIAAVVLVALVAIYWLSHRGAGDGAADAAGGAGHEGGLAGKVEHLCLSSSFSPCGRRWPVRAG